MSSVLSLLQFSCPAGQWTPILLPYKIRSCTLANKSGQDVTICSDPNNSATQDTLPNGAEQPFGDLIVGFPGGGYVLAGTVLIYVKPTSLSVAATVVLRYLQ